MKVGIIGRTNVGKSTLFKALTLEDVEIADRPFTTIDPNRGVAYVKIKCPDSEFNLKCNPHNSPCKNGIRYVPFDLIDVAGLIEGAHEGKGLGNKFLSDVMEADALIHVIDISGKTDKEGQYTDYYDPSNDIKMVRNEIILWLSSLMLKARIREDITGELYKTLSGLRFNYETIKNGISELGIKQINEENALQLSEYIMSHDKPMIIAANKMDVMDKDKLDLKIKELSENFNLPVIPCSAAAELTLKEAEKNGFIDYNPPKDIILKNNLNENQKYAIHIIEKIIEKFGSTGVDNLINKLIFDIVGAKVVFPVEDEKKLSDKRGNVLPDAYLLDKNATAKDLAAKVHTQVFQNYKGAIDCRTGLKIKNDQPLKNGDIIKILV